jgi:Holliday junction resolvase
MGIYEREIKDILSGDIEAIKKATKSCDPEEKERYLKILKNPFIVIRAAGSLGIADLVAIRGDASFLIEVKARKGRKIIFSHESGRNQKKAEEMREKCEKAGVLPIYAYRLKGYRGDSWRLFSISLNGLKGKSELIHSILPLIEESKKGNYLMKWEDGTKLSDFIDFIDHLQKH